jgi:hypothetical protein
VEERSKLHTPISPFRDWGSQPGVLPEWDSHSSIMEHHILDVNQYSRSVTTPAFGATGTRTAYLRPQSPRILPGSCSTPRRNIPSAPLRLQQHRECTRAAWTATSTRKQRRPTEIYAVHADVCLPAVPPRELNRDRISARSHSRYSQVTRPLREPDGYAAMPGECTASPRASMRCDLPLRMASLPQPCKHGLH